MNFHIGLDFQFFSDSAHIKFDNSILEMTKFLIKEIYLYIDYIVALFIVLFISVFYNHT